MVKNMRKKTVYAGLVMVIALGASFGFWQSNQNPSKKPKWEQETPEDARRAVEQLLKEYPELQQGADNPYFEWLKRVSKVGMVGVWKEELQHTNPKARARALRSATPEVLSAEIAIPAILPLLDDKLASVRFEAAAALLRFGSDHGVGVLLELLKKPEDVPLWDLIPLLVRNKKKEAIPVLRELFEKSLDQLSSGRNDIYPAKSAHRLAQGLGSFGNRDSYPLFERYLQMQPEDDTVVEAAGRLGELQLMGVLQQIFNQTKDFSTKLAAAFGLAKLGDESALEFLIEQASLLRGMPEPERMRPEGGRSLDNPVFVQWSEGKPPIEDLFPAVGYLGELKVAQAFPLLAELTTAENGLLVRAAMKSLTLLGDKRAVPVLIKLTDPKHALRYEAARALVFFDDPDAEQAVRRLYPNEESRAKLIKEAKEVGPAEFLRP